MSALRLLRDYQTKTIKAIHEKWDAGVWRPASVLSTGAGKTVIFAHLADKYLTDNPGKRVLILSHTDELVNQAAHKMSMVNPERTIGIVKAERNEVHAEIISASVQSLRSKARRDKLRNVGLIVVDECFPAGTLVGSKPIEDLRPGDLVPSWDERTGREVMAPVVAPMSRIPSGMVRVTMETGEVIHCTPNHPFLTTEGWCSAELLHGASVISFTHDAIAGSNHGDLLELPQRVQHQGASKASVGHLPDQGERLLLGSLPGRLGESGLLGQDGSNEPGARLVTHEGAQSDEVRGEPREDEGDPRGDRTPAASAWREWETGARTTTASRRVPGVADGGDRGSERRADALALQAGHRAPYDEGLRGGGRGIPLLAGAPSLRPEAGRTAVTTRVADVQVLEPGRDGTYGGVCPDGLVYNVAVAGTHTYLIGDGVVVHNCHHATAKTYQTILQHFGALNADGEPTACGTACRPGWHGHPITAGFTATLVRGDKSKLSDVWQDVAIRVSIAFLIRAGYLLDVKGKRVEVPDLNLKEVKQSGGDYQEGALGEALMDAMAPEIVAKAYTEHAIDRKGLIFAPTVDSAYAFAEAFNAQGIVTEVVHGGLGRDERRAILARLKSGETQVVSNCMVLTEGFDEPTVSCAVVARPTKSSGLYQQMVGRVLRPDLSLKPADRGHALILDVVGVSRMHGLQSLVDLSTRDDLDREDLSEDLSLLELEDLILEEEEKEPGESRPEIWYVGPADTKDFDPLGADSKRTWGKTPEGTYWLSAGTDGYVFLADSIEGDVGTYDVVWCAKAVGRGQKYAAAAMTEHRGLQFEMALAWAEEEATERGGFGTQTLTTKKARWRRDPATAAALTVAQRFGHFRDAVWTTPADRETSPFGLPEDYISRPMTPAGELITKGEVAEAIDAGTAARVIDPLVAFVKNGVR